MNRELKKLQTRKRIKDAAFALLSEQDYETTTIEQIAKQAGIAKGTFFNYFSSKEELICDMQGVFVAQEVAKLRDKPGPLIPRLRMVVFQMLRQLPTNKSLTRALLQATLAGGSALDMHTSLMEKLLEAIIPIVVLGQESGELRKDMPAEMIAGLAVQTYFGAQVIWAMTPGDEPIEEQMALTFDLFFKGIAN